MGAMMVQDLGQKSTSLPVFTVVPGRVYELRLLLQRIALTAQSSPSSTHALTLGATNLALIFADAHGRTLDLRLVAEQPLLPGLDPMQIETLPPGCVVDDDLTAGALASRFVVAPPDATTLRLGQLSTTVACLRCELRPFGVLWSAPNADQVVTEMARVGQTRLRLLTRHLNMADTPAEVRALIGDLPDQQIKALKARFDKGGDWKPVLDSLKTPEATAATTSEQLLRLDRLRAQTQKLPRLGFIGSGRGHERLTALAEVYWLRENDYADRIAHLGLDLIIIETVSASVGGDGAQAGWHMAFSSMNGSLPARGSALFAAAKAAGIAVHLWVTATAAAAPLWQGCLAAADRVIVEGQVEGRAAKAFGKAAHLVPPATEPTVCSPAALSPRQPDRILVPMASDVLNDGEFADLLRQQTLYQPLITEFGPEASTDAGLDHTAVQSLFGNLLMHILGTHSRCHAREVMQAASLVLLSANSQRSTADLMAVAMDAVASGAIPVLFGTPHKDAGALLHSLPTVYNAVDLMELQALCRVAWLRERMWRGLMRQVTENHVWTSAHRAALLGHDPFPPGFDTPPLTAIFLADRPNQIEPGLETFRKQSWPNKSLVVIFRSDNPPVDLPKQGPNEQILILPRAYSLADCMSYGIEAAQGSAWVRLEAGTVYSRHILQETLSYLRATQADVIARQAAVVQAGPAGQDHINPAPFRTGMALVRKNVTAETCLSARAGLVLPMEAWDTVSPRPWHKGFRLFWADSAARVILQPSARPATDKSLLPLGPQGFVARLEV